MPQTYFCYAYFVIENVWFNFQHILQHFVFFVKALVYCIFVNTSRNIYDRSKEGCKKHRFIHFVYIQQQQKQWL